MDIVRIGMAIRDLERVLKEESSYQNPLTCISFSPEFFDHFMINLMGERSIKMNEINRGTFYGIPYRAKEMEK